MTRDEFDKLASLAQKAKEAFILWAEGRGVRNADRYELEGVDDQELVFAYHYSARGYPECEREYMPRDAFPDLTRERVSDLAG